MTPRDVPRPRRFTDAEIDALQARFDELNEELKAVVDELVRRARKAIEVNEDVIDRSAAAALEVFGHDGGSTPG